METKQKNILKKLLLAAVFGLSLLAPCHLQASAGEAWYKRGLGVGDFRYKFYTATDLVLSLKGLGFIGLLAVAAYYNYQKACKNQKFSGTWLEFAKRLGTLKENIPQNVESYLAATLLFSNFVIETKSFYNAVQGIMEKRKIEQQDGEVQKREKLLARKFQLTEDQIEAIRTGMTAVLRTRSNLRMSLILGLKKYVRNEQPPESTGPVEEVVKQILEQALGVKLRDSAEVGIQQIEQLLKDTGTPLKANITLDGKLILEEFWGRPLPDESYDDE